MQSNTNSKEGKQKVKKNEMAKCLNNEKVR